VCFDVLGGDQSLVVGNRLHSLLLQTLHGLGVVSQVKLGSDQNDGNAWGMVIDLGEPLAIIEHLAPATKRAKGLTLAVTLSKDGGLTMEKQMRKTSVWG
jgi:hypothetical protein